MSAPRFLFVLGLLAILGGCAETALGARRDARPTPAALNGATADEAFVQARQAALKLDGAGFEAAAARAGKHPLRDWLDYWRLRLRLSGVRLPGNGTLAADDAVEEFLQRRPGTLVADLLRRDWLPLLARRDDWERFDAVYAELAGDEEGPLRCWWGLGQLRRGRALSAEALENLFQPRDPGEACMSLIEALTEQGQLSRTDLWRRIKLTLESNAPGAVLRLGSLARVPSSHLEAALQKPARALATRSDPQTVVIAAMQLLRQDPDSIISGHDAIRHLPLADRAYLTAEQAAFAMRRMLPRALEWTQEALPLLAQAGGRVASGLSDETLVWMTRAALRASDWPSVHAAIGLMSADARRDPAWIYWRARADRALGHAFEADTGLRSIAGQFNFYGQLAAEDLGELTTIPVRAAGPTAAELLEPARNEGFARALRFYELGLRPEGNREWNFQLRGMSDRQLLAAAQWACQQSVLDRCVNTADRTRQEHDFSLRFVTPFRDELVAAAQERELDPAWVYGLIRQESRFIRDARSSAGAQGLMQIIPPTARWIAGKLGVKDFRQEHLGEMSTNLRFGTFYLKSVLDDLDGSPLLASAGYNAGPNRPRNWRATLPARLEGAAFAEIIPFTETRDYVKKVLSNATFYGALITGQPQSLRARLGTVAPASARPSELP